MKATGIVRRMDDLGRVVIPKEIRRSMRIKEGDPLEIFTTREGEVVFKKYQPFEEIDWVKAKNLVRAVFPDLHFGLYNDLGEKQTATNVTAPKYYEDEDGDNAIYNNEHDLIGYIYYDTDICCEDSDKVMRLLKETFSTNF